MNVSLTLTRGGLTLADLVITNDPSAGNYWLPEDWAEKPEKVWRLGYLPDEPDVHGSELISAALQQSTLPLNIYVKGDTTAALEANQAALEDAFGQFNYHATLTVDGVAVTYSCDPGSVRWGAIDSGMVRGRIARASVTAPCYPLAVSP